MCRVSIIIITLHVHVVVLSLLLTCLYSLHSVSSLSIVPMSMSIPSTPMPTTLINKATTDPEELKLKLCGDDDDDDDDNDDVITDQKNTPVVPVEETHSIAEGDADGDDEEKKRENGEEESETALLDETNEKREKKMRPIRTRGSGRNGR
mmetsp:Transcript_7051/g.8924  ORF Transcript_7051/g.8924 Transcript_7051/m.8924 type:complete len:150 (+) Transcript_7051:220-669(+)